MQQLVLDAEVGEIPAELARRGIAAHIRVHVVVEVVDDTPPMVRVARAGLVTPAG
jgi:hypothetical protein